MDTLITSDFFNSQLMKAIGLTLMHSLWQGVLLAIAGGFIIIFTRKGSAALRYNLLITAALLFACGSLITFRLQLQQMRGNHVIIYASAPAANGVATLPEAVSTVPALPGKNITAAFIGYLNAHCNTIVLIWFLIICAKSIRLVSGMYEIYQLKHTRVYTVAKHWENRITELAAQLNIKQAISLAESGLAKVPMVIGHLKPLILIPVGFINALPPNEVEAILLHELAHIRRRDYLVNLLQSFMEILFFFNPAVMWISQLIKAERENCCDDIALKQGGGTVVYIQALLSCQEYQQPASGLSMALAHNKGKLLSRVKRIVHHHNQSLNIMEKTLLAICMVTAGLFTVAFSANNADKNIADLKKIKLHAARVRPEMAAPPQIAAPEKANEQKEPQKLREDTARSPKGKIYRPSDFDDGTTMSTVISKNGKTQRAYVFKRNGILYQLNMSRNKVETLYIDGSPVPVSQYQTKINELLKEIRATARQPLPPVPPAPAAPPARGVSVESESSASVSVNASAALAPRVAAVSGAVSSVNVPVQAVAAVAAAPGGVSTMLLAAPSAPNGIGGDGLYKKVSDKLIKDGIIRDKDNFDISISNDALEVDGVKQPEAIHQQILKLYVKKPGEKVHWSYSNHN